MVGPRGQDELLQIVTDLVEGWRDGLADAEIDLLRGLAKELGVDPDHVAEFVDAWRTWAVADLGDSYDDDGQ